jgi:hypothetical protein
MPALALDLSQLLLPQLCGGRALLVLVAVQRSVAGLYLPPMFWYELNSIPPQTIISLPVHTAI